MFDLTGQVAVITGASAGLGRGDALALARQGANVVLLARRYEKLCEVAEECRALGVKALPFKCDVTDPAQIKAAVKATMDEFGHVEILINNAGGSYCKPIGEFSDELWLKSMALDINGVFCCMRDFGAEMLKAGYGRIINISSILGKGGLPEIPIIDYATAKGAVINLTRQAATEWAKTGITVNAVCPGFFPSESNSPEAMEAMKGFIENRTPMGRPGTPSELDSTIIYLAAKESSYVTGNICTCDGGWTAI